MITKALQKQIEDKHAVSLSVDDIQFLDLYQKNKFNTKKAYNQLKKNTRGECNTLLSYVHKLKPIILELVEANLIMESGNAASTLSTLMTSGDVVSQANIKLEASKTILDRVGLGKKETLQVSSGKDGGLFIIPAKRAVVLEETIIEGEFINEND